MKQKITSISYALFLASACKNQIKPNEVKLRSWLLQPLITDFVIISVVILFTFKGLMGSGVDPHLQKPAKAIVSKLTSADVVCFL